jgi:hypothetical protein
MARVTKKQILHASAVAAAMAFAVSMSAPGAASALQWLLDGRVITSPVGVSSSGAVLLADLKATGGEVAMICNTTDRGTVGPGTKDDVTSITASACRFLEERNGACEAGGKVAANALHLPWETLLLSAGGTTRDMLSGTGGAPGWDVECTVAGILKVADECTSSAADPDVVNVAEGVNVNFLESEVANCSLGGASSGMVIGTDLNENPTGHTLSVCGSSGGCAQAGMTCRIVNFNGLYDAGNTTLCTRDNPRDEGMYELRM